MRVIICGAGQVGYNIASYLAREENDVTVVDNDPGLIARINDELDVNGIVGHLSTNRSNRRLEHVFSSSHTKLSVGVHDRHLINTGLP